MKCDSTFSPQFKLKTFKGFVPEIRKVFFVQGKAEKKIKHAMTHLNFISIKF